MWIVATLTQVVSGEHRTCLVTRRHVKRPHVCRIDSRAVYVRNCVKCKMVVSLIFFITVRAFRIRRVRSWEIRTTDRFYPVHDREAKRKNRIDCGGGGVKDRFSGAFGYTPLPSGVLSPTGRGTYGGRHIDEAKNPKKNG